MKEPSALLQSALDVDREGAVDLVRRTLRSDRAAELYLESEDRRFGTREEFRAWFEVFRRKAAAS